MSGRIAKVAALVAALAFAAATAQAADYLYQNLQPPFEIQSISDPQVTGDEMVGMSVTVDFSSAPSETVLWKATGANAGGAFGAGSDWSLTEEGDTFANTWVLTYNSNDTKGLLTGFMIDGVMVSNQVADDQQEATAIVFDRTFNGAFGTPGSFLGRDYNTLTPGLPFDTFVTYGSAVAISGSDPVGDEFRFLEARFLVFEPADETSPAPTTVSGLNGTSLMTVTFRQDTNKSVIPEPATLGLLSVGTAMLMLRRRR